MKKIGLLIPARGSGGALQVSSAGFGIQHYSILFSLRNGLKYFWEITVASKFSQKFT